MFVGEALVSSTHIATCPHCSPVPPPPLGTCSRRPTPCPTASSTSSPPTSATCPCRTTAASRATLRTWWREPPSSLSPRRLAWEEADNEGVRREQKLRLSFFKSLFWGCLQKNKAKEKARFVMLADDTCGAWRGSSCLGLGPSSSLSRPREYVRGRGR